jgi:hypothetical protein
MALVERLFPTYPRHASRRAEEARQVEQTLLALGVRPCLTRGTREVAEELVRVDLPAEDGTGADRVWSVSELIEALGTQGTLETSTVIASPYGISENEKPAAERANIARRPAPLL